VDFLLVGALGFLLGVAATALGMRARAVFGKWREWE
jgi:hypothetical protein